MDFLMDSAARNGPLARPPGQQETPLRGALRVNRFPTPAGCAWKNASRFSTPPLAKKSTAAAFTRKNDIGYGGASLAALVTPLDGTQASLDGEMSWIAPYKTASRRPAARPNGQSERKPERIITDPAEVILRDPSGHNITLAQWAAQQ